MRTISTSDIIKGLQAEIKKEFADAEYYFISIPEGFKKPAFLFQYTKQLNTDDNYYLKNTRLDIQIIYFGITNDYGKENDEDKFRTIEKLDSILGKMTLKVKDRSLNYNYSYGEADGHLTIDLDFEFSDDKNMEIEAMEMIQKIFINESGV